MRCACSLSCRVVFSTFRKDNEFDPSKSFRSNVLSIIGSNVVITSAYTLCHFVLFIPIPSFPQTKSLFAFGNLFSIFLLIVMAQLVLSIEVVLFNAEAYAPIVKVLSIPSDRVILVVPGLLGEGVEKPADDDSGTC